MKNELNIKMVYTPVEKTNDEICMSIFGKDIERLVQDILINQDGKYDDLYEKV